MTNLDSILKFSPGGRNGNPIQYSCWRIPWTEKPGGLQSMGSQILGHDKPLCRHVSSYIAGFILWHYRQGTIQGLTSVKKRVSS